jgi:enoyl-[acyl-carrier protein] reductase I
MTKKLLEGKIGFIMGLANDKSIAWGIAKTLFEQGAKIVISYQDAIFLKRVQPLADQLDNALLIECDIKQQDSIDKTFAILKEKFGKIDFLVHAIAFSDKNELKGRCLDTTRDNFLNTMDISCYSFMAVAKAASEIMPDGGSIITLTYYGAEKVIPNYNVMGIAKAALESSVRYCAADLGKNNIRVNAISAGPIRTLAASGIGDFRSMLSFNETNSPLQKNVSIYDVGKAALYLISDLASGVSGEIHYVDAGYNILGSPINIDQ